MKTMKNHRITMLALSAAITLAMLGYAIGERLTDAVEAHFEATTAEAIERMME